MKKIILVLSFLLLLTSCTGAKEDAKVNKTFLTDSYVAEFHELNLSNQELTQVPNFEKYLSWSILDDVWSVNLQLNKISKFDFERLKIFPNLMELNISYNELKELDLWDLSINSLYAHKNKLTEANLEKLWKLTTLNLGYNEFVSGKDMKLPNTLQSLELQHNKLQDLSGIEELIELNKLKFEFNDLENSDMKVLLTLKNLKTITATYNKLSKEVEEKIKELNEK